MSATDQHLDRARDALAEAGEAHIAGKEKLAEFYLGAARVHAAIAGVEEQRTANLIAAFERDAIQPPGQTTAANAPFWNALAVDITERLGLA